MRRTAIVSAATALVVVGAITLSAGSSPAAAGEMASRPLGRYQHLVVIYEENHSFDNLYGLWGKVGNQKVNGLPQASAGTTQVDQSGNPVACLVQNDANLVTTTTQVKWLDGTSHPGLQSPSCSSTTSRGATFDSHFSSSSPFSINDYITPGDKTCAPPTAFAANGVEKGDPQGLPGGCTRDMVHRFYQEQYQLDSGKQDRYSTGSDSAGLTQGYYDTTQLPVYQYLHGSGAPNYVVADNFFQAAFGGSFLNHQFLIAGQAPQWDTAQKPVPAGKNSVLDAAGFPNKTYPLYQPDPAVAYNDGVLTQACGQATTVAGFACGNYAVNTMQPSWQPSAGGANVLPGINDVDPAKPYYETNIGDELSAKNVSWNWYAGGWDAANAGHPDPLFQYHHQPFNYFQNYAPGMPGRQHLKDEKDFLAAAGAGTLPAVSFVKPAGEENEHPGYASTDNGESHLVDLLKAILDGPDGKDTLVVVTYDEFGGSWDHVAPPGQGTNGAEGPSDQYGPGTRIPALIIGGGFERSGVDHQAHDTTSILATIERSYGLAPLSGRDAQVTDLRHALLVGGDRPGN
ncbi:alkaline phosphatase family protein [Micromonospora soli]|uniref:alkaline phosphatase family protein n=1 Tax=Micromonospora sp. NBRC 110009 TaxID=3061627 RepID=UPI0026722CEB|nr:alkaline phosphatase family protein [Micromonospora sp. NBRC 110009]WKT99988.1 alkaline phosphatase family protein [Micromonospora sp. NBRC 110009]